jgi:hypothetical protein
MEIGVWLDGGGVEIAAAFGDRGIEYVQCGEVLVDDRLIVSAAKRPFVHRRLRLCWVGEELGASSRHHGRR